MPGHVIPEGDLIRLGQALNLPYILHSPAMSQWFGNAILSRYPIISSTHCKLPGPSPATETRSMLCVDIAIDNSEEENSEGGEAGDGWAPANDNQKNQTTNKVRVIMTHLDHRSEIARMKQLEQLFEHLGTDSKHIPHILMGDFNALTKADYTEEVYGLFFFLLLFFPPLFRFRSLFSSTFSSPF